MEHTGGRGNATDKAVVNDKSEVLGGGGARRNGARAGGVDV